MTGRGANLDPRVLDVLPEKSVYEILLLLGAHASLHKELKRLEEEKSTLQNNLSSAETKAAKATKELIKLTEMLTQKEGNIVWTTF